MVDPTHKLVVAKLSWKVGQDHQTLAQAHPQLEQSKDAIIVSDVNGVRAIDPVLGSENWRHGTMQLAGLFAEQQQGNEQADSDEIALLAAFPHVVAVSAKDGKPMWRFRVPKRPEFGFSGMEIKSCSTGWLVIVRSELALR